MAVHAVWNFHANSKCHSTAFLRILGGVECATLDDPELARRTWRCVIEPCAIVCFVRASWLIARVWSCITFSILFRNCSFHILSFRAAGLIGICCWWSCSSWLLRFRLGSSRHMTYKQVQWPPMSYDEINSVQRFIMSTRWNGPELMKYFFRVYLSCFFRVYSFLLLSKKKKKIRSRSQPGRLKVDHPPRRVEIRASNQLGRKALTNADLGAKCEQQAFTNWCSICLVSMSRDQQTSTLALTSG